MPPHAGAPPPWPVADAELARRLEEEGVVVRGQDVARVVGLMAGLPIAWE